MTIEEQNKKYQEERDKMIEEYDHIHELIMKTDSATGVLDMERHSGSSGKHG